MSPNSKRPALRPIVCAAALVLMGMSGWAQAQSQSLVELFQAAKSYDAAYLSARSDADSAQYKAAHILRSRYRFKGQIRATGEVLVDMMPLLARSGVDAVVLRADQERAAAERALGFFAARGHYQGDVQQPQPVFAR
jgi:hypothetical protein